MKKVLAALLAVVAAVAFVPTVDGASQCPPEVAQAKELLSQQGQASRTLAGAQDIQAPKMRDVQAPKVQDIQAPRTLAGAKDIQAPRMQDIQSPKMRDVQAPKISDVQAPKMRDVQAPKISDVQAPRTLAGAKQIDASKAAKLVKEAEAACKAGNMSLAKAKAEAAIATLK